MWEEDDFSSCVFCSTNNYDQEVKEVREDIISLIKVKREEDLNKSCSSLNNMKKSWFSWQWSGDTLKFRTNVDGKDRKKEELEAICRLQKLQWQKVRGTGTVY